MSLPGYQRSRPVNASWLGEVPEHWRTVPLKFVVALRSGGTPNKDNLTYWDGDVPWASAKDLKAPYLLDTEDHIAQKAVDDGISTLVETGSVLVVVRGMILAHTFPVSEVWRPMAINQDLKAVTARPPLRREFLPWLLRGISQITLAQVHEAGHGTKVIRLDRWLSTIVPVPSGEEQVAIAAFLDHETAKIDALVAEQRRLIELLKEKRQAVISHAVTKGLDRDAPMKPSGVEWLGDVPAHWRPAPIKFCLRGLVDTQHKTAPFYDDGTFLVVRTTNVRGGDLVLDGAKYTDEEGYREWTRRAVPAPGDIIFTREAPAGEACLVPQDVPLCLGQRTVLMQVDSEILDSRFALHALYSGLAKESIETLTQGSTVAHFNMSDIGNIPLLLPTLSEQREIVCFLDSFTRQFDTLVSEAVKSIDLLLERRTALISAAVTGQIDVRGLAPSEAA